MKINVPFRGNNLNWVVNYFPKNYSELHYVEPFVRNGSILLNKKPSVNESINDMNEGIIHIWWALRDEPKAFIAKLKQASYSKLAIKKYKNKIIEKDFKDYLEYAVAEFIIRNPRKSINKINNLKLVADRITNIRIFNKNPIDIVKILNDDDSFIYCNPPELDDENQAEYVKLLNVLSNCCGKVLIKGQNTSLYKEIFADFNKITSKQLWLNYDYKK